MPCLSVSALCLTRPEVHPQAGGGDHAEAEAAGQVAGIALVHMTCSTVHMNLMQIMHSPLHLTHLSDCRHLAAALQPSCRRWSYLTALNGCQAGMIAVSGNFLPPTTCTCHLPLPLPPALPPALPDLAPRCGRRPAPLGRAAGGPGGGGGLLPHSRPRRPLPDRRPCPGGALCTLATSAP